MDTLITTSHIVLVTVYLGIVFPLIGVLFWSTWKSLQEGFQYVKRLHQVPCSHCAYFTGDYRLKCTVHPADALTEVAIECPDYESKKALAAPATPIVRYEPCASKAKNSVVQRQRDRHLSPF